MADSTPPSRWVGGGSASRQGSKRPPKPDIPLSIAESPERSASEYESSDVSLDAVTPGEWTAGHRGGQSSSSMNEIMSLDSDSAHSRAPSMENMIVVGSHTKGTLAVSESPGANEVTYRMGRTQAKEVKCAICREKVGRDENGESFAPCECAFPVCRPCYEYIREHEGGRCPQCHEMYKRMKGSPAVSTDPIESKEEEFGSDAAGPRLLEGPSAGGGEKELPVVTAQYQATLLALSMLDPTKNMGSYGSGSIHWVESQKARDGDGAGGEDVGTEFHKGGPTVDDTRRPLSRIVPVSPGLLTPYRLTVMVRAVVLALFLRFRITTPNPDAYILWLMSVVCELWFGVSWILDQTPKWSPITRETYLDRLSLRFEKPGEPNRLLPVDIFITTADPEKEPPIVTANVVLSVLSMDYPVDKVACYLSDDGAAMLTFEALTETASFARAWVPFCKKHEIEPRAPEMYFQAKFDYTKGKTQSDFIKERRHMKRAYEEFKVRINQLVAKSRNIPHGGWKMADGAPWPGNNRSDHVGMIQVFLQPDGDTKDINGDPLPKLVYVSREKRPGYDHNKKAGAMNALMRASALITNGPFILNLDCDHYINNAKAMREAMCFLMDPASGSQVCYVQFPQRFDGVDRNDRYANHNTVFYDVNMKGLDGQQGPMYVGTGCVFRRQALYGMSPVEKIKKKRTFCLPSWLLGKGKGKGKKSKSKYKTAVLPKVGETFPGDDELEQFIPTQWHAKRFGTCTNFIATVMNADGGVPAVDPYQVLSDAILVISCGYEDNTQWGVSVGWMYGSVTEDIVTGYMMHVNGWRSVYTLPKRPAFKGSAPINLTDRLGQVLRWATGSVEIFFSKHNPIVYHWCKSLYFTQRMAYINTCVYPFTSIALLVYCFLPAICLFTNSFIVTTISGFAVLWFLLLFISIFLTAVLEIRWSGVNLEEWWRNEQFWVIGGTSAHASAVVQGMLKVLAGVDTSFTLTQKGTDDDLDEFAELYAFRFTWLMVPPTTIMIVNILACFSGIAREMYATQEQQQWGRLLGMLFFSFWVLIHLYPFAKGLMGRSNKVPTIVLIWSILLAIILSLLWVKLLRR
ncbi:hypothetical protein CBR_g49201 [Chara braunii]|uniref:Cellulose synthase n=1 Tax=Chara braunii TaxID=69332 RepID=A0A388M4E0_CHABU|nr:hypothetical protein CBR_g49201 [Chara braunii]|eukprot:GBG89411.1 hypothetical protein CBR_g49201 [Chara braunii]